MISDNLIYLLLLVVVVVLAFKISRKIFKYLFIVVLGSCIFIALTGCSKGNLDIAGNMENIQENTLTRVQDIPFVEKSKIDISRSLILGEGKSWSGQLVVNVPDPKPDVFNFYVNNLETFGWKEQTTIRGETSVLNYVGGNNRVAIITIREIMFNNSEVLISVAPYTEEFEEKVSEYINEKYLEIKDWQKE